MDEMRQEVGMLALMAAEQIVGKQVEVDGQQAIVDEVIDRQRSASWQN